MMNKYDEILQIFASQKDEISLMSSKINELERTNMFLMQFIEKKNHLPAVCEIGAIRRYKELAIDKEFTLNTARDKIHADATICDTSLNTSFEGQNPSDCRNSLQLSSVIFDDASSEFSHTKPRLMSLCRSDNVTSEPAEKVPIPTVSRSSNLQLKISHLSPSRRQTGTSRNILNCTEHSRTNASHDRSQSSDEKKDTVIMRSVPEVLQVSNDLTSSSINSDIFHNVNKPAAQSSVTSHSSAKSMAMPTPEIVINTDEDDKLKHALDYLITTLEERKCNRRDQPCVSSNDEIIERLLDSKETIRTDLEDEHTQMKLLLTSQQLKADMFHRTLESNNKKIIDAGCRILQQNSSNRAQTTKSSHSEDSMSEINSRIMTRLSEMRLRRQMELNRLNHNSSAQALCDPRVKIGFIKFTALVKGYIVRTLLETDKVRGVIITIKDTALMALTIRQERLSGDCAQPGDIIPYNNLNRRNYQETVSFQHRLVSQLRHALNELHEIFFTWPPRGRMSLLRNHINLLIRSTSKYPSTTDTSDGQGPSSASINVTKKPAPLSSATLKRRQKLAQRPVIPSSKDCGNKNSISTSSQRKPIYTSPYGCRGYSIGSYTRTSNGQFRNTSDRKSRSNIISHRRGTFRKITESSVNETSENIKSLTNPESDNDSEESEPKATTQTVSNGQSKITEIISRQQQQQWIQPKTVTTSVCSPASGDGYPYKSGFVTAMFDKKNGSIEIGKDCVESKLPQKSNQLPTNYAEIQANSNNADWRSKTFNFSDPRTNKDNNNNNDNTVCRYTNQFKISNMADDKLSNVEVDIDNDDYNDLYQNNSNSSFGRYQRNFDKTNDDPTDNDNVVLVDVSQPSTESDSTNNELKSTFNSNTNHCINKPVVTASNTKYIKSKLKSTTIAKPSLTKPTPLSAPIQISNDFDLSPANIISGRTFRIRKRIVACNSIYSQ